MNKGFTLIEILISMSIFLLSIIFFLMIIKSGFNSINKGEGFCRNIYDAQNIMESLRVIKFEDIASDGRISIENHGENKKIITAKIGKIVLETIKTR